MKSIFVSDLHGNIDRYNRLFEYIKSEKPEVVFIGGDVLPINLAHNSVSGFSIEAFINDFLVDNLLKIKSSLGDKYPAVFIILGNDDSRINEEAIIEAAVREVWTYIHNRRTSLGAFTVYGYSFVPPTPFLLKDWEKYDVSRYVDPGCISPEEGKYTYPVSDYDKKYSTIAKDLGILTGSKDLSNSIFLFHTPPYKTNLDHADLDGKMIDFAPRDVYTGSIAVRKFIEKRQPLLTLHGHIHESASITGSWMDKINRTYCFSAAHNGPELAIVIFNPNNPENAVRELI
jgi:uncharacterized protein